MNMEAQTTPFAIWMNVMAILALVIFIFLYWHNYQLAKEEELPEKFVFEADVIYILLMTLTDFLIARRSMPGAPLPIVLGGTAVGVVVGLAILAFPYFTLRQLKKAHKEMDEEKSIFQKKYWQQLTQKVRRGR